MINIGIKDLAANALIELSDKFGKKEVLFGQLNDYGTAVVKYLKEDGKHAMIITSDEETESFLQEYSDCFERFESNSGDGIRLRYGVSVDYLWEKFRGYLPYDVLMAFTDKQSVEALNT